MSLDTPTTAEVADLIVTQVETALSQTVPLLPKAFVRVLAKAIAGVLILLYKYGGFIFLQMFVTTASASETTINGRTVVPLVEWGRLIGIGDPVAATQAQLLVDVTVENQTGSLPINSQLVGNNGVTYLTLTSVLLNAPTVQVEIRAVEDEAGQGGAGTIGNLDPGAEVSFVNPLANVSRVAVVASQTVTAANGESTDAYRQRVVDRFQRTPQGGAYSDYAQWSEEVAGIINAYPYTSLNPGEVNVYVEATAASSGNPDGIPTPAQLQAVFDSIQFDENGLPSRRPVSAFVNVLPISRTAFDVQVTGLTVDDPVQTQADIADAVTEYLFEREPFIVGLSALPRRDRVSAGAIAGVVDDVVSAAGGFFSTVTVTESAVPVTSYALGEGEKAKLGGLSFL